MEGKFLARLSVAMLMACALAFPAQAIVGGRAATQPYGFMGSLQRLDSPRDDLHVCGVTLVAPQWGITAGHCARSGADLVSPRNSGHPVAWQVRFGSLAVASGGDVVDVVQFIKRGGPSPPDEDIALLKFDRPVRQKPIGILAQASRQDGKARILGWGATEACHSGDDPGCRPERLRQADTRIHPTETCMLSGKSQAILCIGALDGSVNPGNMDSGGAALVRQSNTWKLAALTLGGNDLGKPGPAWYLSLAPHAAWIQDYISGRTPLPADTPVPRPWVSGTVKLGDCSGAVIKTASSRPGDPALVLTNGHCAEPRPAVDGTVVGRLEAQTVIVRGEGNQAVLRTRTTRLLYATMTGTDLALYQAATTYDELERLGVRAFRLSKTRLRPGQGFQLLSGDWQQAFTCTVEATVKTLREEGYTQHDAIRYARASACDPGPGTSGSPLIDERGEIAGIHNTGTHDSRDPGPADAGSLEPCVEGNACEVDAAGRTVSRPATRYGQQVLGLDGCVGPGSAFNLDNPGCGMAR